MATGRSFPNQRAGATSKSASAVKSSGAAPAAWEKFYTACDVAELLEVSLRSVRRWIEAGELAAHRFGAAVRIADADLKEFVARRRSI